jgi:cell division protein FtsQ
MADSSNGAVSRVLAERYAARLRARARWTRLSVTLTVCVALLVLTGYLVVWHTSLFGVRTVSVSGEHVLSAAAITRTAGIDPGTPVEGVDTAAVRRRVGALPRVASVRVSRRFPHTVVVSVTERTPAALLPVAGRSGSYAVVDVDGVRFDTVDHPLTGVPVVNVGSGPATRDAGVRAQIVRGALAAVRALPSGLRDRLVGIEAADPYGITLRLTDSVTVDWGGGDQASRKADVLEALMRHHAGHYDVSAPSAPAVSG